MPEAGHLRQILHETEQISQTGFVSRLPLKH